MHTIPQRRPIDDEGTPLAYSGVMPIAQPTAAQTAAAHDARVAALPVSEILRQELAAADAKRREAEADAAGSFDDSDNLYDNVACTD